MMIISTGSLTFIRDTAKFRSGVAFVPMNVRQAVPIGRRLAGAAHRPLGGEARRRLDPDPVADLAGEIGWWSRATGYFAPTRPPTTSRDEGLPGKNPDAKIAVDQLANAKPWFATYRTVPVRKAIEDELQAVLSAKRPAKEALAAARRPPTP